MADIGAILNEFGARLRKLEGRERGSVSPIVSIATALALKAANQTALVNAGGGAITVTLPAAATARYTIITVKKIDASANAVILDGDGAETIDGAATYTLSNQYDVATVWSSGTAWIVVSNNRSGADDHTIYLLASGARNLTGDLAVTAGKTIDGVDISAHAAGTAVAGHAAGVGAHDHASAGAGANLALSVITGVTVVAAEVNVLDGAPMAASFVIGAEAANVINVAIQLKDAAGADLAIRGSVSAYFSDDANGDSLVAIVPTGVLVIGTDGVMFRPADTKKYFRLMSESDGDIDFNVGEAGAKTMYLILIMPNGKLIASGAITFV